MRLFLLKLLVFFLIGIVTNVNAQYTITGNVNSSAYSCATFLGNTVIYVGDGTASTNLSMNSSLDLYNSCLLGPIQFIVRNNASVDFSPGNDRLVLPEGSSIIIEPGGSLIGGSCNASERIYIGTELIASCNGGAGADYTFNQLILNGGYNYVKTTVSPICASGTAAIAVSVIPTPTGSTTYNLYTLASGGSAVSSVVASTSPYSGTLTTPSISTTTTYYVAATTGSNTTPRKEIVVTVNSIPTITATSPSSICGTGVVTLGATASAGTINWYAAATGGSSLGTGVTFNTPSISSTTTYYVDATNAGCTTASRTAVVATVKSIPSIISTTPSSICGTGVVTLGATASAGTINWFAAATGGSSLGTGVTFNTPSISTTTTYYVDATNSGCTTASRTAVVATINPVPIITTQPSNQLDCEGASVKFKVIASGSGLTYSWQYKRPTDASFITLIGSESNTTYPSVGEIRIDNVGSAQYPNGTQFKVVINNGNCSVTSNVAALSVNSITGISPIATNVVKCYGANYSYTVSTSYPANVVSYQWKKSVTSGVWTVINDGGAYSGATTATLVITSGTPAESAEYRVYITFNNSTTQCSVDSSTRTRKITFLPDLTTPEIAITQPTCLIKTGTITVTIQSATDTYSFDNGANFQASNQKSGLAVGSYNVIIKNTAGCVSPTTTCQIVSDSSIWDGTSWLNGSPTIDREVVFQQNFNSTANIDACSCQVTNGAKVVINSVHTLKVTNEVNVVSGSLTFENNASLVQINDAAINTGVINYRRYTAPVRRYDFTYWSSPVAGQTLKNLSPNTLFNKYYSYDNGWVLSNNGFATMALGIGYIIRAPQNFSITNATVDVNPVFIGVPNNGVVNIGLTGNKAYLLGNPYPSAINADTFLDLNSAVLEGTLYFWTHNSPPSDAIAGDALYNYTSDDYATYNRTGGVTVKKAAVTGGNDPSANIAAGQGFFAPASASGGTLVFNNSMRVLGGASGVNNSQFFKLNTNSKTAVIPAATTDKSRIWLNLSNEEGVFKQTLIGYISGATNNYDGGFDGVTYDGNQYVDFYSVNQGINLAIQGRALPFDKQDTVSLGYKTTIKGVFQISIDHTDGILDSQEVFLEDKDLRIFHNLKKESYSFATEKGVFNNRFILHYITKNTVQKMALKTPIVDESVLVSVLNSKVIISSSEELISKIHIYDISGKLIYQKDEIAANDFVIQHLTFTHQVLVVHVLLANGTTTSIKIIY